MHTKAKWLIIVAVIVGAVLLVSAVHVQGLLGVAEPMWDRAKISMIPESPKPDQTNQGMNERMYACLPMTDRRHMMGMPQRMMMRGMGGQNRMSGNCGTMQPLMGLMMQHHRYGSMDRK